MNNWLKATIGVVSTIAGLGLTAYLLIQLPVAAGIGIGIGVVLVVLIASVKADLDLNDELDKEIRARADSMRRGSQ